MLIGGVLGLAGLIVFGVLAAMLALLFGLLVLPLKLLGFALRGVGFLVALPFLLLGGLVLMLVCGIAGLALFTPIVPVVLIVLAIVWLSRRRRRSAVV
jgi:hypothetical protein